MDIRFFGHNPAIFRPTGQIFSIGTAETISYRFALRNYGFDDFFASVSKLAINEHRALQQPE